MLIEPVKYVIFKEQQQCEAVAEVEAGKLLVLFKNENVKAIAYRCVDKSDDSV